MSRETVTVKIRAKKCTRCKKLYEHYPTGRKIEYNAISRLYKNSNGRTVHSGSDIDLCRDCMNEFDKFMTAFM